MELEEQKHHIKWVAYTALLTGRAAAGLDAFFGMMDL